MIQTGKELAESCRKLAENYKTLYVMGCFGAPMTEANKDRYLAHHPYNRKTARAKMIRAAGPDTFGFDCVCMIKGLLWGWSGDREQIYGGAAYKSGNVPDVNADTLIRLCREVRANFDDLQPGEVLWTKGHVGIYVGEGMAVECTPAWKNGVQVTTVRNLKEGTGHNWTKHGKLPYIRYDMEQMLPLLKRGSRGDGVKILQHQLNCRSLKNPGLAIDGSFGPATQTALTQFQSQMKLPCDGAAGEETWDALLKN